MNDDQEPPKPVKLSTGFKGKRPKKGSVQYKRKKSRPKPQDAPQEDAEAPASLSSSEQDLKDVGGEPALPTQGSSSSTIRARVESRASKRKITNAEYQSELERVYREIDSSEASLSNKDSEIESLKKRNNQLVTQLSSASDAVRASRSIARESKAIARASTAQAGSEVDKLSRLLEKAQADLALARNQLEAKDAQMKQQASDNREALDAAIREKVGEANAKAEVC